MRAAVAWVWVVLSCGDDKVPQHIDAAVDAPIDAPIDAPMSYCFSKADCGDLHCCLLCSPGGACYTIGCADPSMVRCDYSACDPNAGPCVTKMGAQGTCTQFFPSGRWVCS